MTKVTIMKCQFDHDDEAVAVFSLDKGCVCYPNDHRLALCMQHIVGMEPIGTFELMEDLTNDQEFTAWWYRN